MSFDVVMGFVVIGTVVLIALSVVFLCMMILNMSGRSHFNVDLHSWGVAFLASVAAAACLLGLYGYSWRSSDYQASQLPLMQRLADPEAYAGDAFVDTAAEFPSGMAKLFAMRLRKGTSMERAAWDFHLGALFLTAFAFFFLSRSLFNDLWGAALSLVLFIVSYPLHAASPLALEVVGKDHFDATQGVWAFVLFALTLWAHGNTAAASALAGAVVYMHPLLGVLLLAAVAVTALAECVVDRRKPLVVQLFTSVLPGALVMLPFWLLRADFHLFTGGARLAAALEAWYPLAFFAGYWSWAHWLYAAAVLLLAGQALWRARSYEEYHSRFPALLLGLPALWCVGFVFSSIVPVRPLLLAQFYRTDNFLLLLGLAAVGHQIRKYWASPRAQTWAVGGLLLLAFAGPPSAPYVFLVSAVWAVWEWANEREFESYGPLLLKACAGIGLLLGAWGLLSLLGSGRAWALTPDRSLGTLLVIAAAAVGWWRPAFLPRPARTAAAGLVLLLAVLPALRVMATRYRSGALGAESAREKEARQLAGLLTEMTGAKELFLTPPTEKFRLYLGRPVVFEWLDGMAMQWAQGFDEVWLGRLAELKLEPAALKPFWRRMDRAMMGLDASGDAGPVEAAYRALSSRDLAALAEKHQSAIVIAYSDQPMSKRWFDEVAGGPTFKAYQYRFNFRD